MAHRILKCTVCGGDHSIFHCENKCGVCHGDNRKCSCSEQPPSKKKKLRKQKQSSGDQQSVADLHKLYDNLQKEHERGGSEPPSLQKSMTNNKKDSNQSTTKQNKNMTILEYVKRYTDNLTTRKIREGLGLGFTFPIWRTEI